MARKFFTLCRSANKRRFTFRPAITSNCPAGFGSRFAAMAHWHSIGRQSLPTIQILMMRSCSWIIPATENARITPASTDAALNTLAKRRALSADEMEPRLCAIGHSLGSAVAIDFARRQRVQRVVAIAPFTTLREEAARVITGPLSYLLIE